MSAAGNLDEPPVGPKPDGPDARPERGATRRSFLATGSAAVGGSIVAAAMHRKAPEVLDTFADKLAPASVTEDVLGTTIVVRRPKDQCYVTLAYFNCAVDYSTSPPTLVKKLNQIGCSLSVTFGDFDHQTPMHVTEEAFPLVASHLDGSAQKPEHPNASNNPTVPVPSPGDGPTDVDAPPVKAKYGGGSRLMFNLPEDRLPLPIDTASLLNFVGLPLIVHPNAVPPFAPRTSDSPVPPGIGAPSDPAGYTAIELPYNLIISPPTTPIFSPEGTIGGIATVFVNAVDPVTSPAGWTELWHTRLAARVLSSGGTDIHLVVNETNRELRTIRAIWCNDEPFAGDDGDLANNVSDNNIADDNDPGFRTSLTYDDRYDIVRLSSDFTPDSHGGPFRRKKSTDPRLAFGYVPQPATVDNLMLTALGGWLDCDAHWDLPASTKSGHFNTSLLSWRHRAVQGRDTYVRVVRKGYLFPWGHKASLITVTDREFSQQGPGGPVGAYMRQKTFIVVTQPVKDYGGSDPLMRSHGRHLPFTSVEALTLVTPDLEPPAKYIKNLKPDATPIQKNAETVFEPMLSDGAFLFHFRGTDWAGDPIDFRSHVLWVDDTAAYGTNGSSFLMTTVRDKWNGTNPKGPVPKVNLHGQRVGVAKPKDPNAPGDTQVTADSFELGVELPKGGTTAQNLVDASQPNFYPNLHTIEVDLPEAKAASGNPVGTTTMQFADHYVNNAFAGNAGGVFLQRAPSSTPHKIKFNSSKAGGSLTPTLGIDGLSRAVGPISGDVNQYIDGHLDPTTVFSSVDAKLLGGVPLSAILKQMNFDEDDTSQSLLLKSVQESPTRVVTRLDWHPRIQAGGPEPGIDVFVPAPGGDPDNSMDLTALIITDAGDPSASRSIVNGQIRDFELHLFGDGASYFILIPFDSLTFRAQSGQKTDVDVQVADGGVQFQGALSFVQDLAEFLSFDGSGLTINTAGSAITADLTLAIPTIAVGIFSLQNIAFSAGVAIPYNGDPVRFTFAFCSADNPFQLTIMIFTGGGFVELGIGADGLELLSFSFDFGLGFDIDIGIASGQVSLTGGIYYEGEKDGDHQDVTLTAWVKASGGVSALGIVSVSVELYLGLGYQSDGPGTAKLVGDAEMSISVDILFFGFSVGFDVHEEFDVDDGSALAGQPAAHAQRADAIGPADADPPQQPTDNTFASSMTIDDWQLYCTSFALLGVVEGA